MSIIMHIMLTKICKKNDGNKNNIYFCERCDYGCSRKFLFDQHCSTKKHRKTEMLTNAREKYALFGCKCGKQYKHQQSYNRHTKVCNVLAATLTVTQDGNCEDKVSKQDGDRDKEELRGMVQALLKQNESMVLANKEMREMVGEIMPKIGNNNTTVHNKFNLNIFLNEECKDALNLSDFLSTLELKLDDLDNTRQNGFITGITDIFVNGLRELDLNKRPIHCCDRKREILYVKDNNIWERDNNKSTMKRAIHDVAKKQIGKIKEWESTNPDWNKTDEGTTEYIEMIGNITNTSLENNSESNSENKIIKTIAKEVLLDKL